MINNASTLFQMIEHVLTLWREDRGRALALLSDASTGELLDAAGAPAPLRAVLRAQGIDSLPLREADPALATNLIQVLCDAYVDVR